MDDNTLEVGAESVVEKTADEVTEEARRAALTQEERDAEDAVAAEEKAEEDAEEDADQVV